MLAPFNQKSILLTTAISFAGTLSAIAFGFGGLAQAQSNTQEVTINFAGWVGDEEFACGKSYKQVGTSESTLTPVDFRFYVSDLALVDEEGNAVPIELEQDGKWQYQNVALIDFEDGTGACDNGTAETRTVVVGTVPEGDYQNLQFTLGVPKKLNHKDAAIASSPLNLTSLWWNWQGGYKFLRADLKTEQAIAQSAPAKLNANISETSDSKTTHSHDGTGNMQINQQTTSTSNQSVSQSTSQTSSQTSVFQNGHGTHSQTSSTQMSHQDGNNTYPIHLGSTGCQDSARSDLFDCANPNRAEIVLEDFNFEDNVVVADLAELLYQTDLTVNQANTPAGCMSSPEDSDCTGIM
ncbi:MAG: MbnP family copper-binding protein, partial [Waterburya sp.]